MDRIEAMEVFVAAAEQGSLSAASRRLAMPLATVSRKVSELEAHLRTRLVNRTSRRLTLTDAGRSYLPACKRILQDVEEAERVAAGEYLRPRGELVVTAPILFGRLHVLPIVIEFLKVYPEINVQIALSDRIINLQEEHIDVALRIGDLPDSSLVAMRLGAIRRVVCGSPDYFATRGMPKVPTDLRGHDCITFGGTAGRSGWNFVADGATVVAPVRSRLVVSTADAAIDAAVASLGITRVLCYQAVQSLQAGKLRLALYEFEPAPRPVSLVYSGQGLLPQKLRAFLDFAAPRLRARVAEVSEAMRRTSAMA